MIVELLLVGRADHDASIAVADFPEDGGEAEAEDDGDENRPEGVGHDLLEHLRRSRIVRNVLLAAPFFLKIGK